MTACRNTCLTALLALTPLLLYGTGTDASPLPERRGTAEVLKAIDQALAIEVEHAGYPSLSIGILHGGRLVHAASFGLADQQRGIEAGPDTLYGIGSITKVFTATLMVALRDRGAIALDEPVARHLPAIIHLPSDPGGAPQITFRHLATHTSGLPRHPINLPRHDNNPFEGYDRGRFVQGLNQTPLLHPIGRFYNYSNMGYGLLAHALEGAADEPFEDLMEHHVLAPLGLQDTVWRVSADQTPRLAVGYSMRDADRPERAWDMGSLSAAGGLYSTVEDLARFLALHMRAGRNEVLPIAPGSLTELQLPQRVLDTWDQAVGLGWHVRPIQTAEDVVWHSGALGGYSAYVAFSRFHDVGVIVLTNRFRSVERYGEWLLRRSVEHFGRPTGRMAQQRTVRDSLLAGMAEEAVGR